MSIAVQHSKKHGNPVVYSRPYGSRTLSMEDYNYQYSIVYNNDYQFSFTRKVVISIPRTQVVAFMGNNPVNDRSSFEHIHKKSVDSIDISRNSPECIIRDDYII